MKQRAVGLLLAASLALGLCACSPGAPAGSAGPGNGARPLAVETTLEPLTSEDDAQLWMNPDRGYRIDSWCDLYEMSLIKDPGKVMTERLLAQELPEGMPRVCQTYIYLSGFNDRDISEKGLETLDAVFQAHLDLGLRMQPRFLYPKTRDDPVNDAPQDVILRHIGQLEPVLRKWSHAVQFFPVCFVGVWGEWYGEKYPLDRRLIAQTVMEKLVMPNHLYALMRLPRYKNLLEGTPYYERIGIENDSVFGKLPALVSYGTGGLDEGTAQWDQLVQEAAYTPQEGELFMQYWFDSNHVRLDNQQVLIQLSEHRFTTLSAIHSYVDAGAGDETNIGQWKSVPVTEGWLRDNGIQYDPAWFLNRKGETVPRHLFEFIRDHLGYKLTAQNLRVTGEGKPASTAEVEMSLINYGFAAAFNLQSGFAILDEDNRLVSTVDSGSPETWYNRNPEQYADSRNLTHTLKAAVRLPDQPGRYKLAFYLKNTAGQYARLSNRLDVVNDPADPTVKQAEGTPTPTGFHILHVFDL